MFACAGSGSFDGYGPPRWIAAEVADHGGMTGGDIDAVAFLAMELGYRTEGR